MTLRVRFALWTAALLLSVLLAFGAFVYFDMKQGLEAGLDDSLQWSASEVIAELPVEDIGADATANAELNEWASTARRGRVTVRVLDQTGQLIFARGLYRDLPVEPSSLAGAAAGKSTFSVQVDPEGGDPVRVYTVPVVREGQPAVVVQVARSLKSLRETLGSLLKALLVGGPILVLGAAFGGYLLAARALAPIGGITRTARRIAAGDLSARIGLPASHDEVGSLAATFDEMLAQLEASRRRERQFVTDSSHELRTPLAAMQAILSVTRAKRRSPEAYEEALSDLSEEADRLAKLISDLLSAARGETPEGRANESVDLSTLLRDVTDSMRPLAEAKGLALACTVPDGLSLQGDSDALIRLFVNLLDNAVKYTEEGEIALAASGDDGRLRITVTDTGIGIAPEQASHIFDRFYRAEMSRAEPGVGLGLAIAAAVARAHGGHVAVESTPGSGSTFTVDLAKN